MNTANKLYWQLPWAGPRIDGDRCGWAVMPDPALGNAMGVCIPVVVLAGKVTLRPAQPNDTIPLWEAVLGTWITLPPHPGAGDVMHLCLLGYDQPEGSTGGEWVVTGTTPVGPNELQAAVAQLQGVREAEVMRQLLRWPAYDCASNQPVVAADSSADLSMAIAFGCCQYPSGLMDRSPAEQSYGRLAERVDPADPADSDKGKTRPTHLLLLGDQVYVDATAGLLDPTRLDDRFRVPYEGLLRIEPLRRVMRRIPVFCMLDDHEIADNWEPYRQGAAGSLHDRGVAAYWTYQRMKPPAPVGPMPPIWHTTGGPGWAAFLANTRTARDRRTAAGLDHADILGAVQSAALQDWLEQVPRDHLKLVASPAMLLPRLAEHADPLSLDNWQGYPASLHGLLAFLCENEIPNVCFISGDAHIGCDVDITVTRTGTTVTSVRTRSIHAPALYAPLPFANEKDWNLLLSETFTFPLGQETYTCTVSGRMLPQRDGCCLLEGKRVGSNWTVTAEVL